MHPNLASALAPLGVLAALAAASAAEAQEIRGWRPVEMFGPYQAHNAAVPTRAELMAAWPAAAASRGREGNAVARCRADRSGALSDCKVLAERPARAGFGKALLSLAPRFRLKPGTQDDRPAEAPVYISASWPVPDTPPGWRVEPKPGDFATTTTPQAWRAGVGGMAVMNCLLGVKGTL